MQLRPRLSGLAVLALCAAVSARPPEKDKSTGSGSKGLSAQQQQNLQKLKTDLEAIHGKSEATQAQKQAVAQDLQHILSGASRPSQQSVQTLANDLSKAAADGTISTTEAVKLSQDVAVVLNEASISQQDVNKLMADIQTLLKATKLTKQDAQTIYNDVKAVATTAQQNGKTKTKP